MTYVDSGGFRLFYSGSGTGPGRRTGPRMGNFGNKCWQ
jgi:hypothetical protein